MAVHLCLSLVQCHVTQSVVAAAAEADLEGTGMVSEPSWHSLNVS